MDHGMVAGRLRNPTLAEFSSSGRASGPPEKPDGRPRVWDDDEDLRRFIRGGLAAK